ncbi:RNase adapter RapZ [Aliiruegeria sabulilitoris]|uniref:RNase adapter RapZ n=1 Tax=Aliiruegeria sabulilitoris TaxID=1510458 RepID=UPI0008341859|nr:RNase adapter RapZ [Aliiruegeria sabulilitoris]NDR56835.1 RNase adapter RapZ [Pseudoruegeria sp. M32A2M]
MSPSDPAQTSAPVSRFVLVTGPSGAGRSTAIRALEDLGYEVIDNLPLSLVPRLLEGGPHGPALALGIDTRNRDFSTGAFLDLLARLGERDVELLYLDCQPDILLRRYSETRRRHPLAPAESPAEGIARDFDLMSPIRVRADIVIDTSELTIHELRAEIDRWFGSAPDNRLALSVHSFSYKRGLPRGLDMVFDCRFLRNPYWEPKLRGLDGLSREVSDYVAADPRFDPFFDKVRELALLLLPAYVEEGKSYLAIGFGCTGGQHRSVTVAERLGNTLANAGWQVSIRHRELERRATPAGSGRQTGKNE